MWYILTCKEILAESVETVCFNLIQSSLSDYDLSTDNYEAQSKENARVASPRNEGAFEGQCHCLFLYVFIFMFYSI